MATTNEFIQYVCEQISDIGCVMYKKMFGEYMVYLNGKPVLTVCENTVFVKELECLQDLMLDADLGFPYKGAKEHYILNIEDSDFSKAVVKQVERVTPIPKKRNSHS